jgi:crotonobetainyl-CoA:carnitine CoA-transferase CaiB-like acyl-CoA transferase
VPIVDLLAGNQAFTGVVLALFARERTGRGQLVEVTLFDTALSLLHPQAANWFAGGPTPTRTGDTHPSVVPYQTFESRDGPLFIGAANDRAFEVLCQVLERPDLLHDERYRTNGDRVRNAPALAAELARTIAERPGDELADALLARGVAASPVNDVPTVLQHPHTRHRQMVLDIDGQRGLGVPVKLAGTPAHPHTAPRAKGADTLEILGMLGTFGDAVEGYVKPLESPDTFVVTGGTGGTG